MITLDTPLQFNSVDSSRLPAMKCFTHIANPLNLHEGVLKELGEMLIHLISAVYL